jgi:hypothetical protein
MCGRYDGNSWEVDMTSPSPNEYREFAEECSLWANKVRNQEEQGWSRWPRRG